MCRYVIYNKIRNGEIRTDFVLRNMKDISKNVGNQTVLDKKQTFLKMSYFMLHRKSKSYRFESSMGMSE